MRLILNETYTQELIRPTHQSLLATLPTLTYHMHKLQPFSNSAHGNQGRILHLLLEGLSIRLYTNGFG